MPPKAKPQSHICSVCVKYVLDGEDGIICDANCNRWFHPDCVKLDRDEFKKLSADRKRKWFCNRTDCEDNDYSNNDINPITSLSIQMASMMDKLNSLATKDEIATVTSGINDIKADLHKLSSKIDELEPRLKTVEERLDKMEQEVGGKLIQVMQ
ncbi:hypothetical protein J6590_053561 [Homalodisca vitripennis]|nr:hypothetical protein J6590_053561 [Homalodisca vitripennis]